MSVDLALLSTAINLSFYSLIFYTNTLIIFPKFYNTTNNTKYLVISFLLILLFTIGYVEMDYYIMFPRTHTGDRPPNIRVMIGTKAFFWHLLLIMTGSVYIIQQRLREQLILGKEIKEQKLNTELKLLKSQINPHFLFNALNNIYSLSYMKSEKAPESILKLSSMLRYVIEDCVNETVPIQSEVEYIQNYIAFQKIKAPQIEDVSFIFDQDAANIKIAPMLFIPFLENSFKYSKIEELEEAYINIRIKTIKPNKLYFEIENSIPLEKRAKKGAGTGILNVKHRLAILYSRKHELSLEEKNNRFIVKLEIEADES